jgi:hypothetical protein
MIILGKTAYGASNYPAKPGIRGIKTKTLNFFLSLIALDILSIKAFAIPFFRTF